MRHSPRKAIICGSDVAKVVMTEPRLLDEPLSDAELDELEAFLASDAVPQDCMDLEMLDGYLTAVVSGPEVIQPSEWLPQVWSEPRGRWKMWPNCWHARPTVGV